MTIAKDIGKIRKMWVNPCLANPMVWVDAFVPAIADEALTLFQSSQQPVWKQDIKYATGKSWLKSLKQYVNAEDFNEAKFSDLALKSMFEIAEVADKLVWWLFLASVTADFIASWMTLILEGPECSDKRRAGTTGATDPFGNVSESNTWFLGPGYWTLGPGTPEPVDSQIVLQPGETGFIAYTVAYSLGDGIPVGSSTRLRVVETGEILEQSTVTAAQALNGASHVGFQYFYNNREGTRTIRLEVLVDEVLLLFPSYPTTGRLLKETSGISGWM